MAGKGDKRRPGEGFEENYDRIFGKDRKIRSETLVYCKEQKKMIPKSEAIYENRAGFAIHAGFEEFRSTVDGSIISDRAQLAAHNRRNGVTNSSDYSPEYMAKKIAAREADRIGATKAAKQERRLALIDTMRKAGL